MKHLIGKRFELTEIVKAGRGTLGLASLTFVGDDEVIKLESDAIVDYINRKVSTVIRASIESLVEPAPGDEVLTDVHCGNFIAAEQ